MAMPMPPLTHNVAMPVEPPAAPQLVQQGNDHARAGAANRMPERNRAAVHVELLGGNRHVAQARPAPARQTLRSTPRDRRRPRADPCASRASGRAGTGPMPMMRGSTPALAQPVMRASGRRPRAAAQVDDASTTRRAAVGDARRRAGGDDARLALDDRKRERQPGEASSVEPARGCSSAMTVVGAAARSVTSHGGAISAAKCPRRSARSALCWLSSANRSDSSRVMPYWRARISAVSPMIKPDSGHEKPSRYIASTNAKCPILWPHRASARVDQIRHAAHRLDAAGDDDTRTRRAGCSARREAMACKPDAQALLIVCAGDGMRQAGPLATWRAGIGARAGLAAMPDEHLVDLVGRRRRRAQSGRARRTAPSSAGCTSLKLPP